VFTQHEALGLVMALLEGHPAATDDEELVGAALGKVIRALPEQVGRQAAALRRHAAAAPDRHAAHPDPPSSAPWLSPSPRTAGSGCATAARPAASGRRRLTRGRS
jgi:hypothetical protein